VQVVSQNGMAICRVITRYVTRKLISWFLAYIDIYPEFKIMNLVISAGCIPIANSEFFWGDGLGSKTIWWFPWHTAPFSQIGEFDN